jgi:hypothetical protein
LEKFQTHPLFFNPKEIGRSLKEVATDIVKTESQDIVSRWFHSHQDVDLFIWMDDHKNIIKQQLSFHGQVVEWNLIEGVKTGFIFEDETQKRGPHPESELVKYDEALQRQTLEQAMAVVSCIDALKAEEKSALLENFLKDPSLGNLSPEVFLKKYRRVEVKPAAEPGFFKRFLSKIGRWFK